MTHVAALDPMPVRASLRERVGALAESLVWALAMNRRVSTMMSAGERLDGDAVRRIAAELDRQPRSA